MYCQSLYRQFSQYLDFLLLHPQIPDFQIVVSLPNIVLSYQYINGKLIYSAFGCLINLNFKIDPYDWFCGPAGHIDITQFIVMTKSKLFPTYRRGHLKT